MNRKTRNDIILIVSLILVTAALFAFQLSSRNIGSWVVISVDGKEIERYKLSENSSYTLNDGTNTIEIRDNKVWMTEANCPDKLCVKQGKICHSGQCITCLPNKLTVTVKGGKSLVDLVL